MKTPRTRIAQIIADNTVKSGASKQFVNEIAAYLISEKRVGELDSLLRDVQAAWAEHGIVEVIASSAHPLTATVKADITKQIKQLYPAATKVIVTEAHDAEILGGVRLTLADQQLDLSIETQLNKFKQLTTAGKDS
jgi:F0F1-type ATP synthase delta subunit